MKRRPVMFFAQVIFSVLMVLALTTPPAAFADSERLMGFTAEKTAWELQYEALFKAIPDAALAKEYSEALTEHPTQAGTKWDWVNLDYTTKKLDEFGVDYDVTTYYPWWSTPVEMQLEMLKPTQQTLSVKENGFPWQKHWEDVTPGWNAYSVDGEVSAEVVYVYQSRVEDYEWLIANGVDLKGKIGLSRYGGPARGARTAVAQLYGLAGMIMYTDPKDDGYTRGPVYPDGPWRPADSIQRGSLLYIWEYPGDPLTPGWAATKNAHRIDIEDAENLPQAVPTMPIGYGSAEPILAALGGPEAPATWQGGLPFTYHVGPGAKVRMKVDNENRIQAISNIIVTIPGSKYPNEKIIFGGHRDGWVYGTKDSNSATVMFLEAARAFGILLDQGWRPERTIILAMWDAEEYFELGSVEWAEEWQKDLRKNAVMYVNVDAAASGQFFGASAVPALDAFIRECTKAVEEPRTPGMSVFDDWAARQSTTTPRLGRLGGGSDYSVFINYLGIPSASWSFSFSDGTYHSAYDDLYHMEHFSDPGYLHKVTAAQVLGVMAMRAANADILPFKYSDYGPAVAGYVDSLQQKQIDLYGAEKISLAREKEQALKWEQESLKLESEIDEILSKPKWTRKDLQKVKFINNRLIKMERALIYNPGLLERPWFKHMIYATGIYVGYAAQYLPGVDDMVLAGNWKQAERYKNALFASLKRATSIATEAANR